jgi:hypothetical protein
MATRSPERKTRHIPFPGQLFINLTRPYAYENRPLIRCLQLDQTEEGSSNARTDDNGPKLVRTIISFWRHPEDARDFSIQPPSGKAVDEFVLKFQKPM